VRLPVGLPLIRALSFNRARIYGDVAAEFLYPVRVDQAIGWQRLSTSILLVATQVRRSGALHEGSVLTVGSRGRWGVDGL
jgi:hypothetical protein